uniref:Olfactory receptor n=1 Tax=Pan troglodytes TaxID=9598 RepID=A0A2I3SVL8_PANTR
QFSFSQLCPRYTEPENLTGVLEFLLLGLPDDPELQTVLFGLFLSMYLVTVLGNLLIILAVSSDSHLHTPMYFFLSNLSLADIGFASTTVPKMIVDIQAHSRLISYVGCLTQMSFLILFACMESLLLIVMAYDRFVTICHPLHYQVIMSPRLCGFLVLVSFFLSLLDSQLHNLIVLQLTWILFSYYKIVSSILRVLSSGGKYKAFSTCSSHLSVVCLFYGTALGGYLSSAVSLSSRKGAVASVMYMVVTPMLNPFIYSLRNRDIQSALQRLHGRIM